MGSVRAPASGAPLSTPSLMTIPVSPTANRSAVLHGHLYSAPARVVAATLAAVAMASLPVILLLVLAANDPPVTPPVLVRLVVLYALVPWVGGWLVRRACRATLEVTATDLVASTARLRIEIPCSAIARVAPWKLPLPEVGFSLWLRSGRRLPYGIAAADPAALLRALAGAGPREEARAALDHAAVVYVDAKRSAARRGPFYWLGKFVLFALVPTAVLFNTHQHIAYGGALGEYHLLGLASYLRTFAVYWLTVVIYLVLYASVWRGLAEVVAWVAARAAPSHAARMRRATETLCSVVYYGGVPVLLGLRYLP